MTLGSLPQKGNYFLSARVLLTVNGLYAPCVKGILLGKANQPRVSCSGRGRAWSGFTFFMCPLLYPLFAWLPGSPIFIPNFGFVLQKIYLAQFFSKKIDDSIRIVLSFLPTSSPRSIPTKGGMGSVHFRSWSWTRSFFIGVLLSYDIAGCSDEYLFFVSCSMISCCAMQ